MAKEAKCSGSTMPTTSSPQSPASSARRRSKKRTIARVGISVGACCAATTFLLAGTSQNVHQLLSSFPIILHVASAWTFAVRRSLLAEDSDIAAAVVLPHSFSQNLASVHEPSNTHATPVFWDIPKAGGHSIKWMYSACYGLVEATQVGGTLGGLETNAPLAIMEPFPGRRYVNVDTDSLPDIDRARNLGFAQSGLADLVSFSFPTLKQTVGLFTPDHPGRLFAMLRHPVERTNSQFHCLQDATREKTYIPETEGWSVQEYVNSGFSHPHDWMTRYLVGNVHGPLTEYHLVLAKLILKEKVLIGLTSRSEESHLRFDSFFGFSAGQDPNVRRCVDDLYERDGNSNHANILEGSEEWDALASVNTFDLPLYEYATELFEEQGKMFQMHLDRKEALP